MIERTAYLIKISQNSISTCKYQPIPSTSIPFNRMVNAHGNFFITVIGLKCLVDCILQVDLSFKGHILVFVKSKATRFGKTYRKYIRIYESLSTETKTIQKQHFVIHFYFYLNEVLSDKLDIFMQN